MLREPATQPKLRRALAPLLGALRNATLCYLGGSNALMTYASGGAPPTNTRTRARRRASCQRESAFARFAVGVAQV